MIEVITALIIISTVFTLATIIYLNVQRSGFYARRFNAELMLEEVFNASLQNKTFEDSLATNDNITIYQEVDTKSSPEGKLLIVRLEAREDDGSVIAEKKHIVYVADEP